MCQADMDPDSVLKDFTLMNRPVGRMVMSFCANLSVYIISHIKTSIWANPDIQTDSPSVQIKNRKTLPFSLPGKNKIKGSMSVEASLAVPFFLFFIANLMSMLMMYERYSDSLAIVHQQAKMLALTSHLSPGGDDMVENTLPVKLSPLLGEIGFSTSVAAATARCRKWTGYDVLTTHTEEKEEEYVYITDNGSVYHKNRECSHLKVSINVINKDELLFSRNDYGEKYHACEKCVHGNSTGLLFVTGQGNKYHNSANCSGLKRSIRMVKLSDVNGMPGCSSCT